MKFEISSEYDGWTISIVEYLRKPGKITRFSWNHNDVEDGIGGEKIFAKILTELGYEVETKDEY